MAVKAWRRALRLAFQNWLCTLQLKKVKLFKRIPAKTQAVQRSATLRVEFPHLITTQFTTYQRSKPLEQDRLPALKRAEGDRVCTKCLNSGSDGGPLLAIDYLMLYQTISVS